MMGGMSGMGGMGSGWGGSFLGMGFGGITMILVLGAIVFALFWLFKQATDRDADRAGGRGGRALEILKERYARGEIDEQEFRRKREELESA